MIVLTAMNNFNSNIVSVLIFAIGNTNCHDLVLIQGACYPNMSFKYQMNVSISIFVPMVTKFDLCLNISMLVTSQRDKQTHTVSRKSIVLS